MKPNRFSTFVLPSLVAASVAFQISRAADVTWDSLGADDNWSTFDNWSDDLTPADDDITFNNEGRDVGTTVTSIVDADYTISSLRFTHDNTENHTLSIPDTRTLSVTNSFIPTANGQDTAVLFSKPDGNNTATTNIIGLGTFTVDNSAAQFLVGYGNATSGSRATLDMSGLSNFNATVNILGVGRKGTTTSDTTRQESGYLVLAKNSNVTANEISVGDTTAINGFTSSSINQGAGSTLFLSAGGVRVNNLNADTMIFGRGKASGTMQFATGAVSTDTVNLRATDGSSAVTDFILGDRNMSSTSGTSTGYVDFGTGKVDAEITNLYAGRWGTGAGSSKINPLGTFNMGSNANSVVTVTNAYLALGQSTTAPSGGATQVVTGNLNVTAGSFSVTTLNLATGSTNVAVTRVANVTVDGGIFRFGDIISPTTGGSANINFNSGTVASIDSTTRTLALAYNLGKAGGGTTVAFGQASGGTGTLALNGTGTLLGDTTVETVQDTTLGGAVGGAFSLTKDGLGTLTLSGANTYSGNTTVSTATLELASAGSLKFFPAATGITNKVTGPGTATFKGTFNIDLTNAVIADGNSWVLADVPGQSFDTSTFSVAGYTEAPEGTWKLVDGSNTWTFTQSDATLRLAVTASSGYANWLTLHPGILDPAAAADPENDGIENVLEYVLNGNPTASDPAILPVLDASGANFVFTFTRREESPTDTTQIFQYGINLSAWTDVAITGTPGSEVTLGTPSAGLQTVTVTIPKSAAGPGGKLFGRLQAVKLP